MCYSFDCITRMAFTKEIEHIKHKNWNEGKSSVSDEHVVLEYMQQRIKEINDMYGDEPSRS